MPRFSIILPCYQAEATIAQTLASLQAQKFSDWEALCVDDGSRDATRDLLRYAAAGDRRIRVLRNPGKGPSDARNHGAAEAAGEVLAFCDADDLWTADKLTILDRAFAAPECDGAFGRIAFFEHRPEDSMTLSSVPQSALTIPMLLGENPVCTMSNIALRREVFARSGGLRRDMVHNEDLDWLIRLVGQGARLQPIDRVLVHYRVSPSGLSADLEAMRAGRAVALESAARFGFAPQPGDEAVHLRYLARRALRVGMGGTAALGLALHGLRLAPGRFLTPLHRGGGTLAGAALAPLLPAPLRRTLFSR
ncbi:glycosyltransferase family 2 protein [Alloyangia pacifica]|uniref:glycosyltransferase family 2 protein n=1 Tax=Alloyangia pacifica TaxID=311180 RepID=UPI001CD5E83A|nr:glycosyltransferase family 2 protein [Alloyangia pacifica]MCA0996941.1 glycosyltransferase [Alloyangia pacifica]